MFSRSQLFLTNVGPSRLYWYVVNTMWSIYITKLFLFLRVHIWVLCSSIMYSAVQPCLLRRDIFAPFCTSNWHNDMRCLFECFLDHSCFSWTLVLLVSIVNTMWSIYITQELKCDNWTHPVVWLSLFSCTQCVELLDNVVQPCYYIVTDQLLLEQVIDTTLATTRFVCLSTFSITVVSLVLRLDLWYTCTYLGAVLLDNSPTMFIT